jgi:hypothetical protein
LTKFDCFFDLAAKTMWICRVSEPRDMASQGVTLHVKYCYGSRELKFGSRKRRKTITSDGQGPRSTATLNRASASHLSRSAHFSKPKAATSASISRDRQDVQIISRTAQHRVERFCACTNCETVAASHETEFNNPIPHRFSILTAKIRRTSSNRLSDILPALQPTVATPSLCLSFRLLFYPFPGSLEYFHRCGTLLSSFGSFVDCNLWSSLIVILI